MIVGSHSAMTSIPGPSSLDKRKGILRGDVGTGKYQYSFVYDANGNRIIQFADGVETDYVYGSNNEMTDAGSDDFTYDHFGNTKTKVSGGNTTTYNWDFESHLTSIDFPGTSNDDTHEYDGDGRRMRSKLNGASDWTNFVHDELDGMLLAEYTLIGGTFTIKCLYTNGIGLISTNREGTKRYFHFDGSGSTWALSDENEVVKDNYSYTQTGVTISATSTNGPSTNPRRFRGRWNSYDEGAMGSSGGFILLGNQAYFDAALGRDFSPSIKMNTNPYLTREEAADFVGSLEPLQHGSITPHPCSWRGWYACWSQVCRPRGQYPITCLERSVRPWVWCLCAGKRRPAPPLPEGQPWWECIAICQLWDCAGKFGGELARCIAQCAADCAAMGN